jgi:formyl-CoA transferase/CoA:oxalate CoA-transferase
MVAGGNDRLFASLCGVLGLEELVTDVRFRTNPDRVRNREELVAIVSARLRERDSAEWQDLLAAAGVPVAPVADVADIVGSQQTEALGILQPLEHEDIPELRLPALPLSFDRDRATFRAAPPAVGEHTEEILVEAGYSQDEIAALEADRVIRIARRY